MTSPAADDGARPSVFAAIAGRLVDGPPRNLVLALQAPFAVTFFLIAAAISISTPHLFVRPFFLVGFATAVVATLACIAVPWSSFRSHWLVVVGVLDIIAIGLCRLATNAEIGVMGLLTIFPAVWFATRYRWKGVVIGTAGTLCVLVLPELFADQAFDTRFWFRSMLLPLIVLMVCVSAAGLTQFFKSQSAELRQEKTRLAQSLAASRNASLLLETILNTVDVGLYSLDVDGTLVVVNRKQRELGALLHPGAAADADVVGVWSAQESDALIFQMDKTTPVPVADRPSQRALRGEMVTGVPMWLGADPSTRRAVSVSSRDMVDDSDTSHGTIVAMHDITEMVNALGTKDDFVATVSHELRTPLTSIIGYLDLITDGAQDGDYALPSEVVSHLAVVSRNAEQLLVLVSDLLLTAQVEAGTLRLRMSDARLDALANRALDSFRPRAEAAGIRLKRNIDDTPVQHIDHSRISQVIDNLVSNAIKYTQPGGSVRVLTSSTPDATVLTVADTGIGMDPHDLSSLFQKFFRAESARSNAIPGVGLGLVITKAIVDAHQGTITVKSVLGVGTTVRVTLPRI